MQNVGQSDSKKLDCKVNISSSSSVVPSSTSTKSTTTMAKYNPSGITGVGNNSSSVGGVSSSSASGNGKNMSSIITKNNKFASTTSSPIKSDTEYSEFQPRVSDSSESDEESVSEVKWKKRKK